MSSKNTCDQHNAAMLECSPVGESPQKLVGSEVAFEAVICDQGLCRRHSGPLIETMAQLPSSRLLFGCSLWDGSIAAEVGSRP